MNQSNGAIDPDVQKMLLRILDKPYKRAKLCIYNQLSRSKRYNPSQIVQLTSVLDHIAKALIEYSEEKENQLKSLEIAEDYLKIVSTESVESEITEILSDAQKCLERPRIYYRLTFLSLPDRNKMETDIKNVEFHLQRGRQLKEVKGGWELCLMELNEASDKAVILKNQLPDDDEARYRFSMLLIPLITAVVSVIITIIIQFLWFS